MNALLCLDVIVMHALPVADNVSLVNSHSLIPQLSLSPSDLDSVSPVSSLSLSLSPWRCI